MNIKVYIVFIMNMPNKNIHPSIFRTAYPTLGHSEPVQIN